MPKAHSEEWDQIHSEAIELLRSAKSFTLLVFNEDGASCKSGVLFGDVTLAAAALRKHSDELLTDFLVEGLVRLVTEPPQDTDS